MKRIFLSILAVGTALALAAPVWAGGEVLSDSELAGIEAAGVEIERSCALCYQVNKELDVDVDVDIENSFNKKYLSATYVNKEKTVEVTKNENGNWRDMSFDNGILIGGSVQNNNAVNFIMANGYNHVAAQNNFLMLKGDGSLGGASAHGVNQINNAFGYVGLDQSSKTYVNIKKVDVDIDDSFNRTYTSTTTKTHTTTINKSLDVDVDVYKKSVYVR